MSFGPTRALDDVSLSVAAGEIHALVGENGAGKSTLIKILSGVYRDYRGSFLLDGTVVPKHGPRAASAAGIATIHQELSLVPSLSVVDNLRLGQGQSLFGLRRDARDTEWARQILDEHGIEAAPDAVVETLPLATRQLLEIARALTKQGRLLILDEPTSALNEQDVRVLHQRLQSLRARGTSAIYISHHLEEVFQVADRVTVLRDGRHVLTARTDEISKDELVEAMVGTLRRRSDGTRTSASGQTTARLAARGVRVFPGQPGELELSVRSGEILGLTGRSGSGASEVLRALAGDAPQDRRPKLTLDAAPLEATTPRTAIASGVVRLSADRADSVLAGMSVRDNAMLSSLRRFCRAGMLRRVLAAKPIDESAKALRLKAPSPTAEAGALSGGNQQKVALMRALLTEPKVLLLDEPTRGIDIGAKADIHDLIRGLADSGVSVVVTSTDLDELLWLCDRVIVLERGELAAELSRATMTRHALLSAMTGATP